jgi:menaquinone-dependent protoporphyrinogen IX oxidase
VRKISLRKILKIIAVFALLIIVGIASFSIVVLDVAGSLATDTDQLPNGAPIGQAIVVYDPGLTGGAKDLATKIGYKLQTEGYNVVLAGVKSSTAASITGYDLIVVGGPIYAGKPASTIQSYLNNLAPPANAKVGAFGIGSVKIDDNNSSAVMQDVASLPSSSPVTLNAVVKVVSGDNVDAKCQTFVTNLLK